jgi:hypothetical protein
MDSMLAVIDSVVMSEQWSIAIYNCARSIVMYVGLMLGYDIQSDSLSRSRWSYKWTAIASMYVWNAAMLELDLAD